MTESAERGWSDSMVLGSLTAAVILGAAFVAWEGRTDHPMLPLSLFRDRRFSVGSGVITLTFFAMFGFDHTEAAMPEPTLEPG